LKICVLGGGSWGTALSMLLLKNGHEVSLWFHSPEKADSARASGENPALEGVKLPQGLRLTAELSDAAQADLVVFVVPSYALRQTAKRVAPYLRPGTLIVSATKGIECGTNNRMSEILRQETNDRYPVTVLSGPSHAEEVSRGMPTGCVAACEDRQIAEVVQDAFMSPMFRVYTNQDVVGVELCAALKNIIALCCGVLDGLELGDNGKALLMTRAMVEIAALCEKAGGQRATCAGLAGVGDLIVTCLSRHSRNHRAGVLIGQGYSPEAAVAKVGAVVEGYYASQSAESMAHHYDVEMPICHCMHEILYEGSNPNEALITLMGRDKKCEFDYSWA